MVKSNNYEHICHVFKSLSMILTSNKRGVRERNKKQKTIQRKGQEKRERDFNTEKRKRKEREGKERNKNRETRKCKEMEGKQISKNRKP